MGFDYYGWEIDKEYFEAGDKRFKEQTAQLKLLRPSPPPTNQRRTQKQLSSPTSKRSSSMRTSRSLRTRRLPISYVFPEAWFNDIVIITD
jgi:hypothetical protein